MSIRLGFRSRTAHAIRLHAEVFTYRSLHRLPNSRTEVPVGKKGASPSLTPPKPLHHHCTNTAPLNAELCFNMLCFLSKSLRERRRGWLLIVLAVGWSSSGGSGSGTTAGWSDQPSCHKILFCFELLQAIPRQ